jgi:O-antigen/teichoic acid export membrane protein
MSTLAHRPGLAERVTNAMFWNSVLLPVKTLLTFASSVIVVRALSQGEYATFAAVIALLNTIGLWSDLGIENALQKFIPEVEKRFGRSGLIQFIGTLLAFKFALLTIILAFLYVFWDGVVAYFRFGASASPFFLAITLLLFLGILSDFALEFLLTYFHQKATNSMDIIFAIVQPILVVLFVWFGWGVPGVLYARVLASLAYVLLGAAFARQSLNQLPQPGEHKGNWLQMAHRFGRLSGVSYFSNLIAYFSDISFVIFVLTFYGDLIGVALFKVAFGTMLTPIRQFLVSTLSGVPLPMFSRLYIQKDFVKLQEAYASLSRFLTLMLVPSAMGLALLSAHLLRLFFQSRYEPAASITVILVLTLFGESLFHPAQLVLVAFEENRIFLAARLITLVAVPLLFLFVPSFGAVGAALAIGLVRLLSRLYATVVVQHKFKLTFPSRFFYKVSFATALMSGVMLLALGLERPHEVTEAAIRTAGAILLGSATFLIAFKRLGSIEAVDRERLATLRIPFKHLVMSWL